MLNAARNTQTHGYSYKYNGVPKLLEICHISVRNLSENSELQKTVRYLYTFIMYPVPIPNRRMNVVVNIVLVNINQNCQ